MTEAMKLENQTGVSKAREQRSPRRPRDPGPALQKVILGQSARVGRRGAEKKKDEVAPGDGPPPPRREVVLGVERERE
jgi:hypothetical protein